MKQIKATIGTVLQVGVFLLIGMMAIFNLVNSCKEPSTEISDLHKAFEKYQQGIDSLNQEIKSIKEFALTTNKYIDSLNQSNQKTIRRFNYEISKLDELFEGSDTLIVNAVLRYWTDRFYTKLPGFFQTATPNF
jgi:peptidoglycan hydrolase CwlO-like protein